jgi:hypothetical protein
MNEHAGVRAPRQRGSVGPDSASSLSLRTAIISTVRQREASSVLSGTYDSRVPSLDPSAGPSLAYSTQMGQAWIGESIETLEDVVADESVDLIVTSPPFALQRPKEYGNESQESYVDWFLPFADEFWRVLKPTGSLVVDLGGAWESGQPVKRFTSLSSSLAFAVARVGLSCWHRTSTGTTRHASRRPRNG